MIDAILRRLERLPSWDAVIAGFAILEADSPTAMARAWDVEVGPLRGRVPALCWALLCELWAVRLRGML